MCNSLKTFIPLLTFLIKICGVYLNNFKLLQYFLVSSDENGEDKTNDYFCRTIENIQENKDELGRYQIIFSLFQDMNYN